MGSLNNLSWRALAVFAVIIIAIIYVLPTIKPTWWPHKKINLGLDLQGGMHLVLEVDTDKALEGTLERISQEIRDFSRKAHVRYIALNRAEGNRISIKLQGQDNIDGFDKLLDKEFQGLRILSRSTDGDVLTLTLDLPEREADQIKKMATDQALETIRNRIDQFGVSEPDIRHQGEKRILVQLPGIKDTKRAKDLIGRTALLEFKLLDETHDLNAALKGDIPPGSEVLYGTKEDPATRRIIKTPYLVKKRTLLTGAHLTDAKVQIDSQYNEPYVSIDFDKKGGQGFWSNNRSKCQKTSRNRTRRQDLFSTGNPGKNYRRQGPYHWKFYYGRSTGSRHCPACRRAPGPGIDSRGKNRRPLSGNRFH